MMPEENDKLVSSPVKQQPSFLDGTFENNDNTRIMYVVWDKIMIAFANHYQPINGHIDLKRKIYDLLYEDFKTPPVCPNCFKLLGHWPSGGECYKCGSVEPYK